jgi:hypothetical protein
MLKRRVPIFDRLTLIFNGVLALAAVATFLVIYWQLKEMKNSAHLDQRAWVGPMHIDGKLPEPDKEFGISIQVENSGKTFAKKLGVRWHIREAPKESAPDFDKEMNAKTQTVDSLGLLPPHGDIVMKTRAEVKPDQEMVNRFKSGESRIFVFGKITYVDVFDCPHWTTFCYYLREDGTFEIWESHNDADDNHC